MTDLARRGERPLLASTARARHEAPRRGRRGRHRPVVAIQLLRQLVIGEELSRVLPARLDEVSHPAPPVTMHPARDAEEDRPTPHPRVVVVGGPAVADVLLEPRRHPADADLELCVFDGVLEEVTRPIEVSHVTPLRSFYGLTSVLLAGIEPAFGRRHEDRDPVPSSRQLPLFEATRSWCALHHIRRASSIYRSMSFTFTFSIMSRGMLL